MTGRYEGKPFVRLLECYVLWCIGELGEEYREKLELMTPQLQRTYGSNGNWQEIIADQMHFTDTVGESVRCLWEDAKKAGKQSRIPVDPQEFAEWIVDSNFVPA